MVFLNCSYFVLTMTYFVYVKFGLCEYKIFTRDWLKRVEIIKKCVKI